MRGRSPRTREGRIGPTAQKCEERVNRREERELPFPFLTEWMAGMAMLQLLLPAVLENSPRHKDASESFPVCPPAVSSYT